MTYDAPGIVEERLFELAGLGLATHGRTGDAVVRVIAHGTTSSGPRVHEMLLYGRLRLSLGQGICPLNCRLEWPSEK